MLSLNRSGKPVAARPRNVVNNTACMVSLLAREAHEESARFALALCRRLLS